MTVNTRGVVVVTTAEAGESHENQVALVPLEAPPELPPDDVDDEPPELFSAGFAVEDEVVGDVVSFLAACL